MSLVDPDVSFTQGITILDLILNIFFQDSSVPPDMRCLYHCDKSPSKILDRPQLVQFLRENSLNAPETEEIVPYIPGEKRGKPVCNLG